MGENEMEERTTEQNGRKGRKKRRKWKGIFSTTVLNNFSILTSYRY